MKPQIDWESFTFPMQVRATKDVDEGAGIRKGNIHTATRLEKMFGNRYLVIDNLGYGWNLNDFEPVTQ